MTAIPALPLQFPVGEEREVVERRASAWSDPKTWVAICAVLLTLVLAVLGYAARELTSISTDIRALIVSSAEQRRDIKAIEDRVKTLEDFRETQEKAYNFNFTTRLAGAESDIRGLQADEQQGKGKGK